MRAMNRAAVRSARNAPALGLAAAAGSVGMPSQVLIQKLRGLSRRGGVPAAETAQGEVVDSWMAMAARARCWSPALVLAASASGWERTKSALRGTAAWSGRHCSYPGAARSVLAVAGADSTLETLEQRRHIAENPVCGAAMLTRLVADDDSTVREFAAGNPNCGTAALAGLVNDNDVSVAAAVAANLSCGEALLAVLARHPHETVTAHAAGNPSLGGAAAVVLARDAAMPFARAQLAANPHIASRVVALLVADPDDHVRSVAVSHSGVAVDDLVTCAAADPNATIRQTAVSHRSYPVKLLAAAATSDDSAVRVGAASHPECPPALLADLADDNDLRVRTAVAFNHRCPPGSLSRLANDAMPLVQAAAASRITDRETLERFAGSWDWHIQRAVAANCDTPKAALEMLATCRDRSARSIAVSHITDPEILERLAEAPYTDMRVAAAANPAATQDTLKLTAGDRSSEVRDATAINPACPMPVLASLAEDHDPTVAATAIDVLRTRTRPATNINNR